MSTYCIMCVSANMVNRSLDYPEKYTTRAEAQKTADAANGSDSAAGYLHYEVAKITDDLSVQDVYEDLDPVSDDMLSDSDHAWDDVPSTLRSSQQPAAESAPPEGKRFLTMEDLRAAANKVTTQTHEWRIGSHRVHVDRNIIALNGVQVTREQATALTFALSDALKATAA